MLFFTNGDYVHEEQLPSITVAPPTPNTGIGKTKVNWELNIT